MNFNIVTIFPEFFDSPLSVGLLGKALESGLVKVNCVTPRTFTTDRHKTVDDKPYGGGPGLVMMVKPLTETLRSLEKPGRMIMLSPKGRPLDHDLAGELAGQENITLICGRYEGIDERLMELFPIEQVSLGDFVINGGETGALCVIEAVSRLLPEFMHKEESLEEESFSAGLLEYPQYTRPDEFEGRAVPEILTSGDHGRIAGWRHEQSLRATLERRPELLPGAGLTYKDMDFLKSLRRTGLGRNLYIILVHYPVLNKFGKKVAVSLTNLDIHDMSRVSRSYNLGGMIAVTPLEDQTALAESLIGHWVEGPGREANPDRAEALAKTRVSGSLEQALDDIGTATGQRPRVVATSAGSVKGKEECLPWNRVRDWLEDNPVALVFGTGHGLAPEILKDADGILPPVRFMGEYNHLSVRSAVSITVDRLLSDWY